MIKESLIVFADYGLDDAAATVTLFRNEERFSRIHIVPIGGNVPARRSFENCLTLLSFFQPLHEKITVVDTRHIEQPSEYLASIHGNDGMGDVLERRPGKPRFSVVRFEQWLESVKGDETLLSLGPMTLVRSLMEKHSSYTPVIMGGCVRTPPNFKGYEFNQSLDPEAFSFCTRSSHYAVTLDTCRMDELDMRKREFLGQDLYSIIVRADQELSIKRGEEGCYIWDDVAAVCLLHPERFTFTKEKDRDGNMINNAAYVSPLPYYTD